MTNSILFEIPGHPQGKARARTFYDPISKKMKSITPETTVNYENLVKVMFLHNRPVPFSIIQTPVDVSIKAFYRKAPSNKMALPMLKPDLDNICKCVLDALNNVAYRDDSQVVSVNIKKLWAQDQEKVSVQISY